MQLPAIHSYPFDDLPEEYGVYAVYLDFNLFKRVKDAQKKFPGLNVEVDAESVFNKVIRANRLTKPSDSWINLYGLVKCNGIALSSSHQIRYDTAGVASKASGFDSFADLISACSVLASPLYIGKAVEQTFATRFKQHESKYQKLQDNPPKEVESESAPTGKLHDRLYRRGIEMRDLMFVCVSITNESERESISDVEKLLQALANPPLSISN